MGVRDCFRGGRAGAKALKAEGRRVIRAHCPLAAVTPSALWKSPDLLAILLIE